MVVLERFVHLDWIDGEKPLADFLGPEEEGPTALLV